MFNINDLNTVVIPHLFRTWKKQVIGHLFWTWKKETKLIKQSNDQVIKGKKDFKHLKKSINSLKNHRHIIINWIHDNRSSAINRFYYHFIIIFIFLFTKSCLIHKYDMAYDLWHIVISFIATWKTSELHKLNWFPLSIRVYYLPDFEWILNTKNWRVPGSDQLKQSDMFNIYTHGWLILSRIG